MRIQMLSVPFNHLLTDGRRVRIVDMGTHLVTAEIGNAAVKARAATEFVIQSTGKAKAGGTRKRKAAKPVADAANSGKPDQMDRANLALHDRADDQQAGDDAG